MDGAYSYQPLEHGTGNIRLIEILSPQPDGTIRCRIHYGNIFESSYKALSYVWGSVAQSYTIELSEKMWSVHASLFSFLTTAQQNYTNELIWIDALCIDQNSILERNQQVQQMGQLYGHASEVVVWLNDISMDRESSIVVEGGSSNLEPCKSTRPSNHASFDQISASIRTHPYWQRMWVVQEFCLAKSISFLSPEWMMSLAEILHYVNYYGIETGSARRAVVLSVMSITNMLESRSRIQKATGSGESLCRLISRLGDRQCTDIRDRVFALVALSDQASKFRVEYSFNEYQVFLSTLACANTEDKASTAQTLLKLLDLRPEHFLHKILHNNIDEVLETRTTKMKNNDEGCTNRYEYSFVDQDTMVLNGTDSEGSVVDLKVCRCLDCLHLRVRLDSGASGIFRQRPGSKLWLLYMPGMIAGAPNKDGWLIFVGCAVWISTSGGLPNELAAFVPQHPILQMLWGSRARFTANRLQFKTDISLDSTSMIAFSFCEAKTLESDTWHPALRHVSDVRAPRMEAKLRDRRSGYTPGSIHEYM